LQEELAATGLDLNGEKSWILLRATYEHNLGLTDAYLDDEFIEGDTDLRGLDPYTGEAADEDDITPDADAGDMPVDEAAAAAPVEDAIAAFTRVFDKAVARRAQEAHLSGFERVANRIVASQALSFLGLARAATAIESGAELLALDPLFARQYAWYLRRIGSDGLETSIRVDKALERFRGHAPYWSQAWLMKALLAPHTVLTETTIDWLRRFMQSRAPDALQVRAALVLAVHREIPSDEILRLFDTAAVPARTDIVAALALSGASKTLANAVTQEDFVLRCVFEHVAEHRDQPAMY
jgi:hypothetical protein